MYCQVGSTKKRKYGVGAAAGGSAFAAVRKIWHGVLQVHSAIVWVLNVFNPCLPVGVVDCGDLCPPCRHVVSVCERLRGYISS